MIRGHLTLNSELKDEDLQKICAEANFRSFLVRYVTFRWGDGFGASGGLLAESRQARLFIRAEASQAHLDLHE